MFLFMVIEIIFQIKTFKKARKAAKESKALDLIVTEEQNRKMA